MGIAYAALGDRASHAIDNTPEKSCESSYINSHHIWWKVRRWEPDPGLYQLLRQIGSQKPGENLIKHWEDDIYVQKLVEEKSSTILLYFCNNHIMMSEKLSV
jgi:hypothetical protein